MCECVESVENLSTHTHTRGVLVAPVPHEIFLAARPLASLSRDELPNASLLSRRRLARSDFVLTVEMLRFRISNWIY